MAQDLRLNRLPCRPNLGRCTHVIRMDAHAQLSFICCSLQPEWFLGHWDGRKTVRCTGDPKTCEGHLKEWPERAKGYITVCQRRDMQAMLLELTPGAGDLLEEQFPFSESMRGHYIHVSRLRKSLKAPLIITRLNPCEKGLVLPDAVNPEPTILRLWPLKAA